MPDQPTDLHVWDPNAKRLCSCGQSPPAYGLPTDSAQWATWETWHREHLAEAAEHAERTQRALDVADLASTIRRPTPLETATIDLAAAVRRLTAQLTNATTERTAHAESLTRVRELPRRTRTGYWSPATNSTATERRYGTWLDVDDLHAALDGPA